MVGLRISLPLYWGQAWVELAVACFPAPAKTVHEQVVGYKQLDKVSFPSHETHDVGYKQLDNIRRPSYHELVLGDKQLGSVSFP